MKPWNMFSRVHRAHTCRRHSSTLNKVCTDIEAELNAIKVHCVTTPNAYVLQQAGTYKNERVIVGRQGVEIDVQMATKTGTVLNFCANNYLGARLRRIDRVMQKCRTEWS
jgi:hypothetical protein